MAYRNPGGGVALAVVDSLRDDGGVEMTVLNLTERIWMLPGECEELAA
jgi:hypothetical protein